MDPDQFVRDGVEVAQSLRRRFGRRKIVLVGQSWGCALGERMAKARPDLFYAVVGTGQQVSLQATVEAQERYARKVMTEKQDLEGIKALDEVSKLPLTDDKRRFATRKYLIGPEDQKFLAREEKFTGPRPWPKAGEIADWVGGYIHTSNTLVPKLVAEPDGVDLLGYDFGVPIFIVQGKDDLICPTEAAREYAAKIRAPATAYAEIDGGHFACLTDPDQFLTVLRRQVLPLCGRR
jgi:pimeloyl-ACP methyl ester carboxylesterase